jgi:hypothetical protein
MSAIQKMIDKSKDYDANKLDFTADVGDISYNENSQLVLPPDDLGQMQPLTINNWAFGQICQRLGGLPKSYMYRCPKWLRAEQLNYWQKDLAESIEKNNNSGGRRSSQWFVRTYGGHVRAALTDRYVPISNTQLLESTLTLVKEAGLHGKLIRPYVSPDRLDFKMIVDYPDGPEYGIGAYVGNGEVGNRLITVQALIQRGSCTNSIIIADGGFTHKHIYVTEETLLTLLQAAIGQAFKVSHTVMDKIMVAERQKLPKLNEVLNKLRKDNGFSEEIFENALRGTESQSTVMGVVNGLSFAAHDTPDISQDDRIKLETLAGAILANPEDLFGYAARMGADVMAERE